MDTTIFTVTGIVYDWPKGGTRCFGWYPFFEDAEDAVHKNRGNMDESCYYEWIVIEEIPEGVFPLLHVDGKEFWYHYDGEQYVRIHKPEKFKNVRGWGMG
jgi:hypothetical protein